MADEIKWVKSSYFGRWACPYAAHVYCLDRRCAGCGWYPAEDARRRQQLACCGKVTVCDPALKRPDWDDQRVSGLTSDD